MLLYSVLWLLIADTVLITPVELAMNALEIVMAVMIGILFVIDKLYE